MNALVGCSRSDKCCTKSELLKTIPHLTNQDSVFVELSDSTTLSGSSTRLLLAREFAYFCPARQRSEITSTIHIYISQVHTAFFEIWISTMNLEEIYYFIHNIVSFIWKTNINIQLSQRLRSIRNNKRLEDYGKSCLLFWL